MTPLHTRIEEIIDTCDAPMPRQEYEVFAQARTAIRDLLDHPNSRCLNCGTTTRLLHIDQSPLSVCRTCLGE